MSHTQSFRFLEKLFSTGIHEEYDRISGSHRMTCCCGNTDAYEGFYCCDLEGRKVTERRYLCCERCGKIVDSSSGKCVAYRCFA